MKKLNLLNLLFAFLTLAFVSCEKEDLASEIQEDTPQIKNQASTDSEEELFQGIAIPALYLPTAEEEANFPTPDGLLMIEN